MAKKPSKKLTPEQRANARRLFAGLDKLDDGDESPGESAEAVLRRLSAMRATIDEASGIDGSASVPIVPEELETLTSVPEQTAHSGRKIGPYVIRRLIGTGGMGQVFEAMQDHPRRSVALKVMRDAMASDQARLRFEYEVQILGRLQHPNIAQIYDAGVWNDGDSESPYFAMEFIAGREIDEFTKQQKLPIRERLELFLQVCDAISYGHERGVIHRDIKPGNILVTAAGRCKVIDFGVARATDSNMRTTDAQTLAGQLIGTLQYMSPEQCGADSNDIDIRSDVYALGVVLYELLADRLPYDIGSAGIPAAINAIQEALPIRMDSSSLRIPRDVEVIIRKALEKKRQSRYRSAGALGDDIRRYLEDEAILARPPSLSEHIRRYARKHRAIATASVVVASTLVISVVAIVYFAVVAVEQRSIAEKQTIVAFAAQAEAVEQRDLATDRFEQLRSVFGDIFADLLVAVRNLDGAAPARALLIEMGRSHIEQLQAAVTEEESGQLRFELAIAHEAIGDLLGGTKTSNLGRPGEAIQEFEIAEQMFRAVESGTPEHLVQLGIARVLRKQSLLFLRTDPARAAQLLQGARREVIAAYESDPTNTDVVHGFYAELEARADALVQSDPTPSDIAKSLEYYQQYRDLANRLALEHPNQNRFARDVAMALRKIGWARDALGQSSEAVAAFRDSFERFEVLLQLEVAVVRRSRDMAWAAWYLGEILARYAREGGGDVEPGSQILVHCAAHIVTACVREPTAADYREHAAMLVPAVWEELVLSGQGELALIVREDALVRLQAIAEGSPENTALLKLLKAIRSLSFDSPAP